MCSDRKLSEFMVKVTPYRCLQGAVLLLLVLMLNAQYSEILKTCVFAHDELPFLGGFGGYLRENGRWVNFLLYDASVYLNGWLVILVNVASFCIFSYFVFRDWLGRSNAVLCSLGTAFFPSVHLLNAWPLTSMPSFLLLAVAAILSRKSKLIPFFVIFGILFNGVLSHCYFLLPLLFLRRERKELVKILFLWVIGFVVGFVCAEIMTKVLTGSFIHLSGWRNPNYVRDWESFSDNFVSLARSAYEEVCRMGGLCLCLIIGSFVIFLCRFRTQKKRELYVFALLLAVAFSIYAQALPAGILVATRSTLCLYFAIFVFVLFETRICRWLTPLVCLLMCGHFFYLDMQDIRYWNAMGNLWYEGLRKLGYEPSQVKGIVMLSTDKDFQEQERRWRDNLGLTPHFSSRKTVMEWAPAAKTLGFRILDKPEEKQGKNMRGGGIDWMEGGCYMHAVVDDYLFLKLR